MFEKVKKFIMDHKKQFIIGGCLMLAGAGSGWYLYSKYGKKDPPPQIQANFVINRWIKDALPKPDWGKAYDVQEHWLDAQTGCPMMMVDTFLPYLGEFGEKLMSEFNASPDIPVGMIMIYGND